MLKRKELPMERLGDRKSAIPAKDPELKLTIPRIPVQETPVSARILPVSEPDLSGNELKYVMRAVESGWISSAGNFVKEFESRFAQACGVPYAVAASNGTTALHLATAALGLGAGDEVILPTFTMIATANAVAYTGARCVFVDTDPATWNLDLNQVADKITPRTRAVIPVHTYGQPVDMNALLAITEKRNIYVIEDAAEAHGAELRGRRVGSFGHAAAFSFYANKIVTTGEGGMVTTGNRELAQILSTLRDHAFSPERHFWHQYRGFNYRMTNLQAAIGTAQMERFDRLVGKHIDMAARYHGGLRKIPYLTFPPELPGHKNVHWMIGLLVNDQSPVSRDQLRKHLADRGIETRTFFIPMHLQPIFFDEHGKDSHPVAERFCRQGLYLPSSPLLTTDEIDRVVQAVRDAFDSPS
jgi:perosamine synthetase